MGDAILGSVGYGMLRNADEALYIKTLSDEEQKKVMVRRSKSIL